MKNFQPINRREFLQQASAPCMQGKRVLGVDGNGLVKTFDSLVPLAQCLQGLAPVKEYGRFV